MGGFRVVSCVAMLALTTWGAGAGEIEVTVDRSRVMVGDPFYVTVEISGIKVGPIEFPDVEGVAVGRDPVSTQESYRIEGTHVSRSVTRVYRATASRAGTVILPRFEAEVDGQRLRSDAISVEVTGRRSQREPGPSYSHEPQGPRPTAIPLEEALFLEAEVDRTEVFQGAPIRLSLMRWQVNSRQLDARGNYLKPDTEGFIAIPQEPKEKSRLPVDRRGRGEFEYIVSTYEQTLFPTATGQLTIGPWRWEGEVQLAQPNSLFGNRYRKRLASEPLTVTVKPLPQAPADFSGAVGVFQVHFESTRDAVEQGESFEVIVTVSGVGNPNAIGEPPFPAVPGVYVSDPEKRVDTIDTTETVVRKDFIYRLTPSDAGTLDIPAVSYTFFNPENAAYETVEDGPVRIRVVPSLQGQERVVQDYAGNGTGPSGGQRLAAGEILPIVDDPGSLRPAGGAMGAVAAAAVLPVAAYVGVLLFVRRQRMLAAHPGYARALNARRRARDRLDAAHQASDPAEALMRALTGYVADVCAVPAGGITSADAADWLAAREAPPEAARELAALIRQCERARYAGSSMPTDAVAAQCEAAKACIDRLDTALAKGKPA